jgi:ethanolamine phosphate phosphodiesterase
MSHLNNTFRSFQTAMTIFEPDVVLILGDVFDEGNWVDDKGFEEYVERFKSIFYVPTSTRLYAIHGNHDINFHYAMHPHLINRFNRAFNTSAVRLIQEKKVLSEGITRTVNLVAVNSMAMERDGCNLCKKAESEILSIEKKLLQLEKKGKYSKPIVLQHFPTYRTSDELCLDKDTINNETYREKWDTLSKEASGFIQETLKPASSYKLYKNN